MGDFGFEDESDIFMENSNSIGPALREASELKSTNGGLDGGEVTGGNIKLCKKESRAKVCEKSCDFH